MTNTVTPTYTDNVSVVAATTLARGSIVRGTLDLRSKVGAYLFIKLARQGTTGLTNGIDVLVRRVLNNDAATPGGAHPGGIALLSGIAAGTGLTLDRWLQYDHTAAQADTVRNKADAFAPLWVTGGALYEVVFDYGDDAAGESVTVQCKAQTYDSDTIA